MSSPAASRSSSPSSRSNDLPPHAEVAAAREAQEAVRDEKRSCDGSSRQLRTSAGLSARAEWLPPTRSARCGRASQFGEPPRRGDVVGVAEGDEVAFGSGHPTVAGVSRARHLRCPHQARVGPLGGPGLRDLTVPSSEPLSTTTTSHAPS